MSWRKCRALIASDLWRHTGRLGFVTFCRYFLMVPGFRYAVLLRFYAYSRSALWCQFGVRHATVVLLHHYGINYGMEISRDARIGSGFYIGHFGGIFVAQDVVIGDNFNISQGVTLGRQNRGAKMGCPVIGNSVYIGPGAKIIGNVHVGDNAAVGANAVVVNDVPRNTSVGGIPARPVSNLGSEGYVNRTDYPPIPAA